MARRKNVLEPQETTLGNRLKAFTFEDAKDRFIRDCKIRNLSEHTVKYYKNELRLGLRYLEEHTGHSDPAQVVKDDIRFGIIARMMEEGRKETAINARLRAVRAFFNYLEAEGIIAESDIGTLKLVKEKKNVIVAFSDVQVRMMLGAPNQRTFTGIRDYTLMLVMLETGIRLKEIVGIKTDHIDLPGGRIRIVDAKGYKERIVPIQKATRQQIKTYLQVRGALDHDFLFVNIDNEPLSKRRVQDIIRDYGEYVGIKNVRCSPHTFRHTFAKMSVQNGANVFELQAMLGHESLEMVRRYVHLFSEDVAIGHAKFSPVERLSK